MVRQRSLPPVPKRFRKPTWSDRWTAIREQAERFARLQWEKCHRCRECRGEVKFMDELCPHCGAKSPVVVPMGVPAAVGMFVVLVLGAVCLCM